MVSDSQYAWTPNNLWFSANLAKFLAGSDHRVVDGLCHPDGTPLVPFAI
jgi:hypothetical protein